MIKNGVYNCWIALRGFRLYPYYETIATKVTVEYVIYDLSNVMTAIGGNLGLFLGYSCINILIWIAEIAKACYSKKVRRKNWSDLSTSQIKVTLLTYKQGSSLLAILLWINTTICITWFIAGQRYTEECGTVTDLLYVFSDWLGVGSTQNAFSPKM